MKLKTKPNKSQTSSIDTEEIAKFNQLAKQWWDPEGPLKTLHDINPCRLAFIEQYMALAGSSVLDVGSGGGILAEAMSKKGALVSGLDADPDIIAIAHQHASSQSLAIHYTCLGIEDFSGESFQAITCMEMLEHVAKPEAIIQHCAQLLKPSGYLFLSTINRTLKAYLTAVIGAEYVLKLLPKQTHDYQRFIKPSELATMVRQADLELIDLKGMDYNPFTRAASLQESVSVNYLMVCYKP
ncbi:MAG: bifunctional 3-demethylubiquinol 3-O-methyltransferase/2-polyprenyl-6-hydroxyphenol methylase [Legionellales bacterium RIFCSPHIGHO2_12_FULL_42_9]|nr:MAG: bifunctional 3-demethylubiquinol 3-O-methyltransferase/2-polyprenyl-6-hydroxyphenol methylase [Legionellales bacterium RIFCSPHIGHO2_12_FULL_42_9]